MGARSHVDADILEIVLDWPETRNALGPAEADALREALDAANAPEVRCVLLRSAGPAFCAGGNLREILALVEKGEEAVRARIYASFQGLFRVIRDVPVPIVAAVAGPAIGLGLDLALACDVRVFGPAARARQGWSSLGLIPATGGLFYAVAAAGADAAWRLLAAGDRTIEAAELAAWGLGRLVPDADADARATARALAAQPRDRLAAAKALVRETDFAAHLRTALDFQVGFLLDPAFADAARRALGDGSPRRR